MSIAAALVAVQASAWSYQVNVVGNTVNVTVTGLTGNQCCGGASLDLPIGGGNCSIPCGTGQQTATLTCNSVGTHALYIWAADPTTPTIGEFKQTTVDITVPPAPACPQFDLISGGIKVLTHQYQDAFGSTVPYPAGQTADGETKISLRPRAAPAGTDIYLKVIDPPDASTYGAPHQSDDNVDVSAGTLFGAKTRVVTLPQAGTVDLILKTTLYASGDNYVVQASADPHLVTDPNFVCDPNAGCRSTPVITAWKRMYVEMDDMYRNSQPITFRILVGDSVVYVNDRGFRRGDAVRLLHAPSATRSEPYDVDGFYTEDRTIVDVARNNNSNIAGAYAITLDAPLARAYFTEGPFLSTPMGDAIADLSRNAQRSADPLFHFSQQYYVPAFADAFVEVIRAGSSGVGVPFHDAMTPQNMAAVGNKWLAARLGTLPPSNFGLATAAATRAGLAPGQLSLGTTVGSFSYIWRQNIDDATSGPRSRYPLTSGLNADIVSGETLVHEMAHQWQVNPGYGDGHCNQTAYTNPSAFATMYCEMNSAQNSGQYGDGIIRFHYTGNSPQTADSEYMDIRKTPEPKP